MLKRIVTKLLPRPQIIPKGIPVLYGSLLTGKVSLVTGGTRGIGYAIAESFLRHGARVLLTGRDRASADAAARRLREDTSREQDSVAGIDLDISREDSVAGFLHRIPKEFAALDILVNNAGTTAFSRFGSVGLSSYDEVLDCNLRGTYFLTQEIVNAWLSRGCKARILNVCSTSSRRPATTPYEISKWGMRGFTLGLAKKYVGRGIVVNGIAPGPTSRRESEGLEGLEKGGNPSGRLVTPEEVANMATILVSPLAEMVVGDIVYMGGGAAVTTFDDV